MKNYQNFLAASVFCVFLLTFVSAQSGGSFEITQSVIASGGESGGGAFSLTGTSGQTLAGENLTGGRYGVRNGFWQSFSAPPTAASVAVGGRVVAADGRGVYKARVTLLGATGETRTFLINPFGYFRFDEIAVGQAYIFSVRHKRYQFANETQVIFVGDEITNLVFNALP